MSKLGTYLDQIDTDRPIPTGFKDLDGLLAGGLRPRELIAVAGRSSGYRPYQNPTDQSVYYGAIS